MRRATTITTLALLFSGCAKEQMGDCFKGRGPEVEEQRLVAPFTALVLNDKVDVTIAQDTTVTSPVVVVKAGRNVVPNIGTEVRDGALHITDRMRCNWVRDLSQRPQVHITVARLERIKNQGVGDVTGITTIHGDRFEVKQWDGHGTVTLQLDVRNCHVELHTGVGETILTGRTDSAYFYSATTGRIDARALQAAHVHLHSAGVCDMYCHAAHSLDVELRALGDVYYAGTPAALSTTITGSGHLIHLP